MNKDFFERLIELRHYLHSKPENSGKEIKTAEIVYNFLLKAGFTDISRDVGGPGIIAIHEGEKPGRTVLFRCELDALPLQEDSSVSYRSKNPGVSHLCGHDGHLAIMLGLAEKIRQDGANLAGKIILLFQSAEETAVGAKAVLTDPRFRVFQVDHAIAQHNIPGYETGAVLLRKGIFASTSRGMIIRLKGVTCHAAEPGNGKPPTLAMTGIIENITFLPQRELSRLKNVLTTIVYTRLGEIAFGTSPGYAEIMATLRAGTEGEMDILCREAEKIVKEQTQKYNLKSEIEYTEIFPVTYNNEETVAVIEQAARKLDRKVIWLTEPFSWSEDFGYISQKYPSAMFGLGSGLNHPRLHNPDFDFPDELIMPGVDILFQICQELL